MSAKKQHPIILIFDFDGVLLNSSGASMTVLQCLKDPWFEWNYDELNKKKYGPIDIIKIFEKSDAPGNFKGAINIYRNFRTLLPARYKRIRFFIRVYKNLRKYEYLYGNLIPGIEEMLNKLHDKGVIMGICTNSELKRIQFWMNNNPTLKNSISAVVTRDERSKYGLKPEAGPIYGTILKLKKKFNMGPINRAERVFFVGDNASDNKAASNAGIKSIAVLSGHGTNEELLNSKADYLLDSITDIFSIPDLAEFF